MLNNMLMISHTVAFFCFRNALKLKYFNQKCLCYLGPDLLYISGAQNFDVIRFATYRTACKLRYIQKKTNCKYGEGALRYCLHKIVVPL